MLAYPDKVTDFQMLQRTVDNTGLQRGVHAVERI
jgi:hypothetical protein